MKLYCSLLMVFALLVNNKVKAQDFDITYNVLVNTYVREVDTNMVQSQYLKSLSKDYFAKVITVTKDSVYMLCYLKDRFTRTEFGLTNRSEKEILLFSNSFNFPLMRLNRATNLYQAIPLDKNLFKLRIAEINKERIDMYDKRIYPNIILDSLNRDLEPMLIRIAVIHKSDFENIFVNYKKASFTAGLLVVPFKIRPSESLYEIDALPSYGFSFGVNFRSPNAKYRFILGTGFLASRVKINPQSIAVGTNPLATTYFDPRYYHSYTIPLVLGYEYKSLNMGLIMGWEQILATTPIPVPFDSRFWTGVSFGYRIF